MTKTWLPLESNPDVMNDYVGKMGLDLTKISFHDVMSTEDWALEMIPRPVLGAYVDLLIASAQLLTPNFHRKVCNCCSAFKIPHLL
jgi:Ubiquitin carboxyl-terminal hydrolase, family 1